MSDNKKILCLANSRKPGGRCFAGKEIVGSQFGDWIRPVSTQPSEAISEEESRYENGLDPSVLDLISIPMIRPKPKGFQSENYLIDPDYYWTKIGRATWSQALTAVDKIGDSLWINESSSYSGTNDRVSEASATILKNSLSLIKPTDLKIVVAIEGAEFGNAKRRVRATFSFNGEQYKLSVTDPFIERQYLQGDDGTFPIKTALLCVSLGELWEGYAYKLAAAIITPDRAE